MSGTAAPNNDGSAVELLVFGVGLARFGVDLDEVGEILDAGAVAEQSDETTVVDLESLFGQEGDNSQGSRRNTDVKFLVTRLDGATWAFQVTRLIGVQSVPVEDIRPFPDAIRAAIGSSVPLGVMVEPQKLTILVGLKELIRERAGSGTAPPQAGRTDDPD